MSRIFLSWASSDRIVVTQLIGRLRDLGLDAYDDPNLPALWEYQNDMKAGGEIPAEVDKAIKGSDVAVLCLSDQALTHKWIISEVAICFSVKKSRETDDPHRPLHIIPVVVGPLANESLKPIDHLISSTTDFRADVSRGSEEELGKLADQIFEKVSPRSSKGIPLTPKRLPIAVIAMTDTQADTLFTAWHDLYNDGDAKLVWQVCEAVGIKTGPPDLFKALATRYGQRPEDMKPFTPLASGAPDLVAPAVAPAGAPVTAALTSAIGAAAAAVTTADDEAAEAPADGEPVEEKSRRRLRDQTLMETVHESLRAVNKARVRRGRRPLFPRWIHGELFARDIAETDTEADTDTSLERAEAIWRSEDSLLIIDQISVFHEAVRQQLRDLPASTDQRRTATLCLPPYTQHTRELETRLWTLVHDVAQLRSLFSQWRKDPERMVAFDTTTSVTLRSWLHRRFSTVPDRVDDEDDEPSLELIDSMLSSRRRRPGP